MQTETNRDLKDVGDEASAAGLKGPKQTVSVHRQKTTGNQSKHFRKKEYVVKLVGEEQQQQQPFARQQNLKLTNKPVFWLHRLHFRQETEPVRQNI